MGIPREYGGQGLDATYSTCPCCGRATAMWQAPDSWASDCPQRSDCLQLCGALPSPHKSKLADILRSVTPPQQPPTPTHIAITTTRLATPTQGEAISLNLELMRASWCKKTKNYEHRARERRCKRVRAFSVLSRRGACYPSCPPMSMLSRRRDAR